MAKPIPASERPEPAQLLWTSLLATAAWLPMTRYLEWQVSAFLLLITGIRFVAMRWPAALPGGWLRALLTFAGVANSFYAYQTLVGQYGGTALLATMIGLKLLELRAKRDLRLVAILLGFLVVAQFLFDQSFGLALYLALIILGAVALLVELGGGLSGAGTSRPALRIAASLALQALPLTVLLFLLFPRLTAPLWDLGLDERRGLTGMSDSMEPGAISELVVDGSLAFRVRFAGAPPARDQLYWRGPVLWQMDGRRWSPGPGAAIANPVPRLRAADALLDYEVVLEPTKQRWLFALDLPLQVPPDAGMTADFQLLASQPVTAVKRYGVRSALAYQTPEPDPQRRAQALQLPDNITPRMRALVDDWRQSSRDDWELVQRGLAFFNREAFHYTLLPPALGANPADQFLFETRSGFCEHYASSFALLMRIAGIPTRVVLGYLGGEDNDLGGYQIVRQSDAHAWVEVLIAERGWVRVDPTAAVDPSRIDNRSAARLLGAGGSVRFNLQEAGALARMVKRMQLVADTLDAAWKNWVLDFSVEDQLGLLDRLGLGALREYGLAVLMLVSVALALGVMLAALMREQPHADPLASTYATFCKRLVRAGLARTPHEGPRDFCARAAAARPDLAPQIARFSAIYLPARYGRGGGKGDPLAELRSLLRDFRPRPPRPRHRTP